MSVIPKQQIYQMWASDGTYLGVLRGVQSIFKRIQDINTIGPSAVEVRVSMALDNASQPVKAILTEDNKWITTESGVGLTTEGEVPNYGVDKSKIRNGNIVKIIEVSDYHPNGITVFTGKVRKWKVNFGTSDDAKLYLTPSSFDMNNKLVKSGIVAGPTQLVQNNGLILDGNGPVRSRTAYFYNFAAAGMSNISSITLLLGAFTSNPVPVTISLVDLGTSSSIDPNNFDGTPLISSTVTVTTSTAATEYIFPLIYNFIPGHYYGFSIFTTNTVLGNSPYVYYSSSDQTSLGTQYVVGTDGSGWHAGTFSSGVTYVPSDIYFRFSYIPPFTKAVITDFEPGAFLKSALDIYNSEGGVVKYTAGSIESTGINVATYTFQTNTIAELLDILLGLSPAGFYYAIDPGTNIISFKRVHAVADHILIFKKHIQNLDLSASIEGLKNDIFFTGGLSGATNLFIEKKNAISVGQFDTQIDRISDVKVLNAAVGGAIASNYLDKVDDEVYETIVSIVDGMTDITTYQLGETIGFAGFSNFADSVIIPIVRIARDMDIADFNLGALPVRQSDLIQSSQEDILAIQTVANPTQPS